MAYTPPKPIPDNSVRHTSSVAKRKTAADQSRPFLSTITNGEAEAFDQVWPTNFTKGLPHTAKGIVAPNAFEIFFEQINAKNAASFDVPLGPKLATRNHRPTGYAEESGMVERFSINPTNTDVRSWESPRAGHVYDLQGPDAGSVGMAPAPRLGSDELVAEMAEDYAMALLRDVTFEQIRANAKLTPDIIGALNSLPWFDAGQSPQDADGLPINQHAKRRRQARLKGEDTQLSPQSLFRGSSFGCMDGPYISQFLLIGNAARGATDQSDTHAAQAYNIPKSFSRNVENTGTITKAANQSNDGYIIYGAQRIDQRIDAHEAKLDYMTDWASWLDVQNGADRTGLDKYETNYLRFITTPRDLATFVHFDALYQAYLNACLFLLAIGAKSDAGFPEDGNHPVTRTPFATFGGPHILTLVTETATRSLKAVRRQKYNHHLRARPEALGAVATLAATSDSAALGSAEALAKSHLEKLRNAKSSNSSALLDMINAYNMRQNSDNHRNKTGDDFPDITDCNYLLPMAFPEGSPMHPAYGAGHATVAGSCVTVLKTFFELFKSESSWEPLCLNEIGRPDANGQSPIQHIYVPDDNGASLTKSTNDDPGQLTLVGELNKLAANISIGRNMAGVHYYSDYYDSLRMGERIAIGMLHEQMYTYPEPVSMRLTSFDNERLTLKTDGTGTVSFLITDESNNTSPVPDSWWSKFVPPAT